MSTTRRRARPSADMDALARGLLTWFAHAKRTLPWRVEDPTRPGSGLRDPYRVLVSEVMLQQTQVSRVIERFEAFVRRFPDVRALAEAPEDDVLAAWTGLGYYRRARLLHRAAIQIMARTDATFPASVADLRELSGVGAYTAGAVASLAFGSPAPVVDTNVARVLLRVGGKTLATSDPRAQAWCWRTAQALVDQARTSDHPTLGPGRMNEALMELGALICTSRGPDCDACPLGSRGLCAAGRSGRQDQIPLRTVRTPRTPITHLVAVVTDAAGRVLLEQRPRGPVGPARTSGSGLWAGLWQCPTIEVPGHEPQASSGAGRRLAELLGPARNAAPVQVFHFHATHRDVRFMVFRRTRAPQTLARRGRIWVRVPESLEKGMSSPMRRILMELAGEQG